VRGPQAASATVERLPAGEQPCFQISRFRIEGDIDAAQWLGGAAAGPAGDDGPEGRCLGTQGLNLVLQRMQNALVAKGLITTRVGVGPQDLNQGALVIKVTPGLIHAIRHGEDAATGAGRIAALPMRAEAPLNLRDMEQALENFKPLPSADTEVAIVPASQPGYSDVVITRKQGSPLRATLGVDDSGARSTGRYQGSLSLAYDNPAGLNDLAYLTLNHDLGGHGGARGTNAVIAHYSVPFGYWAASVTLDGSRNRQTIAGLTQNYVYSGNSRNAELRVSRVVVRDSQSKTTVSSSLFVRQSHNFIDDTEVEVQRRRVGGWTLGVDHHRYIGDATLDAGVSYRRGTGAFGSIEAPEDAFGEGSSRFAIVNANIQLNAPFQIAGQRLGYTGSLRAQFDNTRLAAPQHFSIGGRYTVRGFDGEAVLSAERGWVWRNELAMPVPAWGMDAYLGVDGGAVGGPTSGLLIGKRLAGAVAGLRGNYRMLRYDVFIGTPISKPDGFQTARTSAGFELSASF